MMRFAHRLPPLHLSVLHGDLKYTYHPVLIGHYEGDTIAGVERIVDKMVGDALSQRYHLGCYPGRIGTAAIVLEPPNKIQRVLGVQHGGIVIGLGKWGELTPSILTHAVSQGVMEYCLHVHQCRGSSKPPKEETGLMINSLLIGSNTSANIAVEDSVNAIMRGVVLANRALTQRAGKDGNSTLPHVAHVQFVERLLDVAVDAAKSMHRVVKRLKPEFDPDGNIHVNPYLEKGKGGQTRLVPSSSKGYWRRWTISAVVETPPPRVSLPAVLKDRLRTMLEDDTTRDPRVYKALLDLALNDQELAAPCPRKLRFLALSDRARAEATVQDNQPELITQLIQQSVKVKNFNRGIAKTLFELLIPSDLKDSLRSQENVVFILDEMTANYPWELMSDAEPFQETCPPLCVRMGMVRQLQTVDYDPRPRDTLSRNAFVLGNPLTSSNYPDLPGAMEEAKRVAALLENATYETEYIPARLGAGEVFKQLFARPYRIMHIAAHGYYSDAATEQVGAKAGVVLNGDVVLTAAEIAQLDPIPELVFLNCCYLGQVSRTPSNKVAMNKLAASLAGELIRKGVRAVVAAGWPVQDEPAQCFAETFYKTLLEGQAFGVALKNARRETWTRYRESNTWGAYQAYGDPDFSLAGSQGSRQSSDDDVTVAAEEVLMQVDGLSRPMTHADEAEARGALSRLEQLCAVDWLKQGNVQERLGAAYGECGLFADAVERYQHAAKSGDTANPATLRAIEQWINLVACLGEQAGDQATIKDAIEKGEHLLAIASTPERLSILGSAYKRLAQLEGDRDRVIAHLKRAAAYYHDATEMQQEASADSYAILNVVVVDALLGKNNSELDTLLSGCEALAQKRFHARQTTWEAVTIADVAMIRAFVRGTLAQEQASLVQNYRSVFSETSASPREQDSALKQIIFVRTILEKLHPPGEQAVDLIVQALTAIQKELAPQESKPKDAGNNEQPNPRRPRHGPSSAKRVSRKKGEGIHTSRRPMRRRK